MSFRNVNAFKKRLKKRLTVNPIRNSLKAVNRSTMVVRDTVVVGIAEGSRTGVEKPDGSRRSGPGEYPKTDGGELVANVTTNVKRQGTTVIGQIISGAPYSEALEFGTTKMAPRPFMQPSLRKNEEKITNIFIQEGAIDDR